MSVKIRNKISNLYWSLILVTMFKEHRFELHLSPFTNATIPWYFYSNKVMLQLKVLSNILMEISDRWLKNSKIFVIGLRSYLIIILSFRMVDSRVCLYILKEFSWQSQGWLNKDVCNKWLWLLSELRNHNTQ